MPNTLIELAPNCSIELLIAGDEFRGIGAVSLSGIQMRSIARPIVVRLDTPDGILYTRLQFVAIDRTAKGVNVRLKAKGVRWGRAEYGDDYDQSTVSLFDSDEVVEDSLTLIFEPAALTVDGREFRGFSYALRFESATREIHRALIHATWEIGGAITGNIVLSQGQCNMPVYRGSREAVFTTACLKTLDQYGTPQGNSFQLGPRGGLVQGFDFQHSPQGALLQYWPTLDSVSSLVESPKGSDLLHVVDEIRFPLSRSITTHAKHVLFCAAPLAEHEARNLWWETRDAIYGLSRAMFHIAPTSPAPEIGLKYGTRVVDGRLRMNIGGSEVDSTEVPLAIAERILPVIAAQGVTRFMPEVMNESDVTVLGMKRKLDDGVHGDLHCSSVCSTHRFFPSEFWGGIKAWRVMADKARSLGIEIGAWFAPHFSPRAALWAEHPEYRMTSVTGLPAGGGYGFQTLVVADWNTAIFDLVLADLKKWKDEGGLDYIFTDSLSNMGLVQANYSAAMRTNWKRLGELFGEIQKVGIKSLSCECISPWLASRFGVADLRGDLLGQDRSVAGQNDFGWWANELDMAGGLSLFVAARKRTPEQMEEFLFNAIASGGYICYEHEYSIPHKLADWWVRLNHTFNQVRPQMKSRRLLANRAGVQWNDGDTRVIWTFTNHAIELPASARIEKLNGRTSQPVAHNGRVTLPARGVYRIA